MAWHTFELAGAEVLLDSQWYPQGGAAALYRTLRSCIAWEQHSVKLFGCSVPAPRLSCWVGDPDASYQYSGVRYTARVWPKALLPIRERLRDELGVDFNSVLANLYRDGCDCMGWHSDDEAALGPRPVIASLSLGATRRFVLKRRGAAGSAKQGAGPRPFALSLEAGSVLLMRGDTQRHYRHAVPRTAKTVGPRINLTFRRIVAD